MGAGGHAKVLVDILQLRSEYRIIGLLDENRNLWGSTLLGVPILGGDDLLPQIRQQCENAFVGLGSIGRGHMRKQLFEMIVRQGFSMPSAIHPTACVARSAKIGRGVSIMAGAIVNACALVGDNVIINSAAIIEHDCVIEDHVHVAPGARLAGNAVVGCETHIGIGATVLEGRRIGSSSIIGGGAVVTKDMPDRVVAAGVPARIIRPCT